MSGISESLDWLRRHGLLRPSVPALPVGIPFHALLLRLCDGRGLEGGLSVARDLKPDELFGPLAQAMGGRANRLKLLDVRMGSIRELEVELPGRPGLPTAERWEVPHLRALIAHLNRWAQRERTVRKVMILGEWEDALQLWCLPPRELKLLLDRGDTQAENREEL